MEFLGYDERRPTHRDLIDAPTLMCSFDFYPHMRLDVYDRIYRMLSSFPSEGATWVARSEIVELSSQELRDAGR